MTFHRIADVYKQGVLAGRIERHAGGTLFSYLPKYLDAGGPPVATTLPWAAGRFSHQAARCRRTSPACCQRAAA